MIELDTDATGTPTQTIGVGFSPGDEAIADPYYYVNHWPGQSPASLAQLDAGQWHTDGWIGAVLLAADLVAAGDARDQEETLARFLDSGIAANRALLAG